VTSSKRSVNQPRKKRVSTSRALGMSSDESTRIQMVLACGTHGPNRYEVWVRGYLVSVLTDRWMADAILSHL